MRFPESILKHYILIGQTPVACDDVVEWGRWFQEQENRMVRLTRVGRCQVSTIFLGLDHNWTLKGGPVLFETMVFLPDTANQNEYGVADALHEHTRRCRTWLDAERQHDKVVAELKLLWDDIEQIYPPPLPVEKVESKA